MSAQKKFNSFQEGDMKKRYKQIDGQIEREVTHRE